MGLLTKGFYFGFVKGKLSCTPEQAKRMFGFVMKPDAQGVILRKYHYTDAEGHRKTGIFINNYFPPSNPQTPDQQANRSKFSNIGKIAIQHTTDIIRDIWQPLAEIRTPSKAHGCNLFRGVNMQRMAGMPYTPEKMLISDGDLEPTPAITSVEYHPDTLTYEIHFDPATTKNGLPTDHAYGGILNITTNDLWILTQLAQAIRSDGVLTGTAHEPTGAYIGYVYFRSLEQYSPSTAKLV